MSHHFSRAEKGKAMVNNTMPRKPLVRVLNLISLNSLSGINSH
uniref:Uncharacterized protein n=1 Tax=Brassica oleracea TaxID=3712 RepID=A0A3P6EWW4_BRAOL|nr:unnamed protein product [Brassica oleracea]